MPFLCSVSGNARSVLLPRGPLAYALRVLLFLSYSHSGLQGRTSGRILLLIHRGLVQFLLLREYRVALPHTRTRYGEASWQKTAICAPSDVLLAILSNSRTPWNPALQKTHS